MSSFTGVGDVIKNIAGIASGSPQTANAPQVSNETASAKADETQKTVELDFLAGITAPLHRHKARWHHRS